MKKIFLVTILLLGVILFGQEKFKVTYASQMKFDIEETETISSGNIDNDAMNDALKAAMEEVHYYELILKGNESSYKEIEKINNDLPKEGGFSISISAGNGGVTYKNVETLELQEESSNFGKDYIVVDTLKPFDWKISRTKEKILNYEVKKARAIIDSITTVDAWFTTQIPVKSGPADYWGLPGLILKIVNKRNGKNYEEYYFEATSIEILEDDEPIEKPVKGEKISRAEYDAAQDEQLQKLKEMYSDGVDTSD